MADPSFFPGFEGEDEAAKKPQPAAKPTAPAKPAFDPFAGVKVDTKTPVAPPSAAAPVPAPAKPTANRVAKAPAAPVPAPAPAPVASEDADVKPGSRKDLWKCPHCGAGNKPDRNTCRTCGKSPDEPVISPWYKNNLIRAGILAVIGLVIVGVVLVTRVDVSMREPLLANVDKAPRIAGKSNASIDLGNGMRFEGESRISVCGRVAAVIPGPGGTILVALALGPAAQEEKPEAKPANGGFEVAGVVLACRAEDAFNPKTGQLLSLTGVRGVLVKDGRVVDAPAGILPVAVDGHQTGK